LLEQDTGNIYLTPEAHEMPHGKLQYLSHYCF
jgi:hypothetical protein